MNGDDRGVIKEISKNRKKIWHSKGGLPDKARIPYIGRHLSWDIEGKILGRETKLNRQYLKKITNINLICNYYILKLII